MNRVQHKSQNKLFHTQRIHLGRYGLMAGMSFAIITGSSLQAAEQASEPEAQATEIEFEEVIVTGSHIRGAGVSVGSKVNIIGRAEIDRSGLATIQDVLKTLPQNFQGGPSEDTRLGDPALSNFTSASGVNLRGLGAASTLLLINGRRMPVAGDRGSFTDISSIPVTAIERIEVLPDGASAIYGADAIAGVVNVILRKDYDGAETRLRYGTVTDGGLEEYQLGQTFGKSWNNGHGLLSYEYHKRDSLGYEERPFTVSSDLRPLGGDDFRSSFSNPGNILDPVTYAPGFAVPFGQDGTSLNPGDFLPGTVNLENSNAGFDLLGEQERHSVFVTLSQELSESVELYAEGRFSARDFTSRAGGHITTLFVPSSNAFFVDPTGFGFVLMNYSFLPDLGPITRTGDVKSTNAVIGSKIDLKGDWALQAYGSFSREKSDSLARNLIDDAALAVALADPDPVTAFNPYADGSNTNPVTLDNIRGNQALSSLSKVLSFNMTTDGSLFDLPGGAVKLAIGADYRKESYGTAFVTPALAQSTDFQREVMAVFGELYVPLVGEGNRRAGMEKLVLSLAGRYEDYRDRRLDTGQELTRDIGGTFNPKFGLLWQVIDGLNLRATYGTSFKAPTIPTLGAQSGTFALPLDDPSAPSGSTFVLLRGGTNPDLKNETATTWTIGVDYTPQALPDLTFELTYFNIDFRDRIRPPGNLLGILHEEDKFSAIITRNPSVGEVDALCNGDDFLGDPAICGLVPIGAIIDGRTNNTSRTKVSGFDFNVYYGFDADSIGRFDFKVNGNYLITFKEAFSEASAFIELVDTMNNPVDFRMRGSVTWSGTQGLSLTSFVNYADSYRDNITVPNRKVGSWTTVDLTLAYNSEDRLAGLGLRDTIFTLGVQNLFDRDPPFVNNPLGLGYDPENADPLGRFISFNITKKW